MPAIRTEFANCAPDPRIRANQSKFVMPASDEVSLKGINRQASLQFDRLIPKMVNARGWNRRRAAKRMGIRYCALPYRLKEGERCSNIRSGGRTDPRNGMQWAEVKGIPAEGNKA